MKGKIYLIPTTLGDSNINSVLPEIIKNTVDNISYFIVENIRTSRRYIRKLLPQKDIDSLTFYELNKHTDQNEIPTFIKAAFDGYDIGIMSEAGNPGIADPGSTVVIEAHKKNISVIL